MRSAPASSASARTGWMPLIALLVLAPLAAGADYAVLPGADESGNGSAERPFASIAQALRKARSGDVIHLARGATYREAPLNFPAGVTIAAAGPASLPPPTITTSQVVPALKPWAENPKVLTATVERPVLDCHVGGAFMRLARYPDQGWMRTAKGSTPEVIVDPGRAKRPGAAPGRWKGAQVRWRRWSWWWETRPITADDGVARIALGSDGRFQDGFTGEGSAWCVDNCLAELDAPGEWFWDAATKVLYVYPPIGSAAKPLVEVVVEPKGFGCGGATLRGVGFARIAGTALQVGRASTITGCSFSELAGNAIDGTWEAGGTAITGCSFSDVRNVAIAWLENPAGPGGTRIEGNTLERIGMQPGYGGSGSWRGAGMIIHNAKPVTVRLNRVIDTGYAGIIVGSDGHLVERNVFVRCMGQLNDGAAIYLCANRTTVRENIVLDTVGNLDTSHPWYPLGHGIWSEFLSDFREQSITGNTVFGSGGHGLFLTNNYRCEVRENLLVGNRLGALHLSGNQAGSAQDHVFAGNVLVAMDPSRRLAFPENIPADWRGNDRPRVLDAKPGPAYGTMAGTRIVASPGTALLTLDGRQIDDPAAWRQACPWADPAARVVRASALLLINDSETAHEFPAPNGSWRDVDGKGVGRTVPVAPFRGVVVLRDSDAAGLPPYVLASGLDYRASPAAKPAAAGRKGKAAREPRPAAERTAGKPRPAPALAQ